MAMDEGGVEGLRERMARRYVGKPVVLVLDSYVVDCVGGLSAEKQAQVGMLVANMYGGKAKKWRETVRGKFKIEARMDEKIRGWWEAARANEPGMSPFALAVGVVDYVLLPGGAG